MEASLDNEKKVLNALAERFPAIDLSTAVAKPRRIYLGVEADLFMDALSFLANDLNYDHLCTITGLDTGENFEFLYHIAGPDGIVFTLKYKTARGDGVHIPSVLPIFHGATFYERELEGLLGVTVDGLPEGRQYPLPDNWPKGEYPMRKDWKPGAKTPNPVPPARQGIPVPEGKGEGK
jgi:Ni,Fe-hydrogenase III component G